MMLVLLPVLYSVLCGLCSYIETKKTKTKKPWSCHVLKSAGVFFSVRLDQFPSWFRKSIGAKTGSGTAYL